MANETLMQKTILSDIEVDGWLYIVDPTDTTESAQGTSKRVLKSVFLAEQDQKIVDAITDSTLIGGVTTSSSVPPTGNIHAIGVGEGTYTNWGGMIVPANNFGTLQRVDGVYSVSLTAVDLTDYAKVSDVATSLSAKANLEAGKNIFNWEDVGIIRGAFMYDNGAQATASVYSISHYIEILPSTNYYCNKVAGGGAYNTWYDENKVVISTFNSAAASSPVNAKFVRYSLNVNDTDDISTKNIQVEQGTIATPYESYLLSIPSSELGNAALKTDIITLPNKIDKQIGKNLFNKDADGVLLGHFISGNTLPTLSDFNVSDYIEVLPSTTYTHSSLALGGAECAYYTDEKVFISNFTVTTTIYFSTSNCPNVTIRIRIIIP